MSGQQTGLCEQCCGESSIHLESVSQSHLCLRCFDFHLACSMGHHGRLTACSKGWGSGNQKIKIYFLKLSFSSVQPSPHLPNLIINLTMVPAPAQNSRLNGGALLRLSFHVACLVSNQKDIDTHTNNWLHKQIPLSHVRILIPDSQCKPDVWDLLYGKNTLDTILYKLCFDN